MSVFTFVLLFKKIPESNCYCAAVKYGCGNKDNKYTGIHINIPP